MSCPLTLSNNWREAKLGDELGQQLKMSLDRGWRMEQLAEMAETIADDRHDAVAHEQMFDLVLSGPEAAGIATRDTAAVMHALLAEATHEVAVGWLRDLQRPDNCLSLSPCDLPLNRRCECGAVWTSDASPTTILCRQI